MRSLRINPHVHLAIAAALGRLPAGMPPRSHPLSSIEEKKKEPTQADFDAIARTEDKRRKRMAKRLHNNTKSKTHNPCMRP